MARSHSHRTCRLIHGVEVQIESLMLAQPESYPDVKGRGRKGTKGSDDAATGGSVGSSDPPRTLSLSQGLGLGGAADSSAPGTPDMPGTPNVPGTSAASAAASPGSGVMDTTNANSDTDMVAGTKIAVGKAASRAAIAPPPQPVYPSMAPDVGTTPSPMPAPAPAMAPQMMPMNPPVGAYGGMNPMQMMIQQNQQFQMGMMHQMQEMQRQMQEMQLQNQKGYGKKGGKYKSGKGKEPY